MIKILSTKLLPKDILFRAKNEGIAIDEIEFISIKMTTDDAIVEKIKQYSQKKITAVFTSANAVSSVFAHTEIKPDWDIFCISGKTKSTLLKYVGEEDILCTATDGNTLADNILEDMSVNSVVFFCGNKRLNAIPDKLSLHGVRVEELIVYKTISAPKKLEDAYDGILFFSPSAVKSFFSVNKIAPETVLFSVGKTTEKAIIPFSNNKRIAAPFPSAESMEKEIKNYFMAGV